MGKSNKSWEPDYLKSNPGRYCGLFKSNNWLPSTAVWWIAASGWYFGQIWPAALYLTLGAKAVCPAGGRWCIALILNVTRLAARSLRVALFLGEKCGLEVVVCWVGQLHQQVIIISYHLLKCSQCLCPQQHRKETVFSFGHLLAPLWTLAINIIMECFWKYKISICFGLKKRKDWSVQICVDVWSS